MYQAKLIMLAAFCAVMVTIMVLSSGGTVNLTVGVTEVSYVEQHYGAPAYTFMELWGGCPCQVYTYPHWGFVRYIYICDGRVVHIEDRG